MSPGFLRAVLVLAAVGAVLMLLGTLGVIVNLVGLAAILLATVLSAPAAREETGRWWALLGSGAVLALVGALLSVASDTIGGLVSLIGGIAVLIAVAFGYPARSR